MLSVSAASECLRGAGYWRQLAPSLCAPSCCCCCLQCGTLGHTRAHTTLSLCPRPLPTGSVHAQPPSLTFPSMYASLSSICPHSRVTAALTASVSPGRRRRASGTPAARVGHSGRAASASHLCGATMRRPARRLLRVRSATNAFGGCLCCPAAADAPAKRTHLLATFQSGTRSETAADSRRSRCRSCSRRLAGRRRHCCCQHRRRCAPG